MIRPDIEKLRELAEKAYSHPWGPLCLVPHVSQDDSEFIAAFRNAAPDLFKYIEDLEAALSAEKAGRQQDNQAAEDQLVDLEDENAKLKILLDQANGQVDQVITMAKKLT